MKKNTVRFPVEQDKEKMYQMVLPVVMFSWLTFTSISVMILGFNRILSIVIFTIVYRIF